MKPSLLARKDLWVLLALVAGFYALTQWAGGRQAEQLRALARPGDILMISSESCVFCKVAHRWLTEQRVPFRECLVERDGACMAEYQARGASGTPTFVVRNHTVLGFDRPRIIEILRGR
jgi:glutaredoxin